MKELLVFLLFFNFIYSQVYDISIPENDTASYNYADFRLWISDSTDTLKGIYWYMHPNNGDSRSIVNDSNYQVLASNKDFAKQILKTGFHISFTGMITFVKDLEEVVESIPIEKIMLETDSPYLTPKPYRGKQNQPKNIPYIANKIAEIKDIDLQIVAETTTDTALKLFNKLNNN